MGKLTERPAIVLLNLSQDPGRDVDDALCVTTRLEIKFRRIPK